MKYFESGKEITKDRKNKILLGKTKNKIHCDQNGNPIGIMTDDIISVKDPLLKMFLDESNIPIKKTFIVTGEPLNPFDRIKTIIFEYW